MDYFVLYKTKIFTENSSTITIANNVFGYTGRLCAIYLDSSLLAGQMFFTGYCIIDMGSDVPTILKSSF